MPGIFTDSPARRCNAMHLNLLYKNITRSRLFWRMAKSSSGGVQFLYGETVDYWNKSMESCYFVKHQIFLELNSFYIFLQVIEESLDFINERAKVDKLMVKCQKISERIGKAIREQSSLKKVSNRPMLLQRLFCKMSK